MSTASLQVTVEYADGAGGWVHIVTASGERGVVPETYVAVASSGRGGQRQDTLHGRGQRHVRAASLRVAYARCMLGKHAPLHAV
jgi:hypothetical protein